VDWPFTAAILDPVRLCLIVAGPARIVEVARWFTRPMPVIIHIYIYIYNVFLSYIYMTPSFIYIHIFLSPRIASFSPRIVFLAMSAAAGHLCRAVPIGGEHIIDVNTTSLNLQHPYT
jgi:hypothetical protein